MAANTEPFIQANGVRCRPENSVRDGAYLAALFCAASGSYLFWAVCASAGRMGSGTLTLYIGSIALLLASLGAVSLPLRMEIVADAEGLHWRRMGPWHHAAWDRVTAYYDQRRPHSVGKFAAAEWQRVVETRAENNAITKLVFYEQEWTNERPLRAWIQQHATAARRQSWAEMRRNPEDWPGAFHYDTAINRNSLRWLHQGHRIGLTAVIVYFGWRWQATHTLPGWEWLVTPTGLFFVGKQILLLALYPSSQRTGPYLKRKIRADAEGLIFTDGPERERIAWGEITDFYQDGFRSVIATEQAEWDFLGTLTDFETLRKIIPRYAVNSGQTKWHRQSRRQAVRHRAWR